MRGFQRWVWWPKWTPASRSWRRLNSGRAMVCVSFSGFAAAGRGLSPNRRTHGDVSPARPSPACGFECRAHRGFAASMQGARRRAYAGGRFDQECRPPPCAGRGHRRYACRSSRTASARSPRSSPGTQIALKSTPIRSGRSPRASVQQRQVIEIPRHPRAGDRDVDDLAAGVLDLGTRKRRRSASGR